VPAVLGKGELSRTEVLERLGMKDFARVAQLSAEEAIRLIMKKEKDAEQARWAKFDAELARRVARSRASTMPSCRGSRPRRARLPPA